MVGWLLIIGMTGWNILLKGKSSKKKKFLENAYIVSYDRIHSKKHKNYQT